jgi:hypothetical protein
MPASSCGAREMPAKRLNMKACVTTVPGDSEARRVTGYLSSRARLSHRRGIVHRRVRTLAHPSRSWPWEISREVRAKAAELRT